MAKLKEQTTIVLGELGVKLNGYQEEKLSQLKLLKKLYKILSKYWQLANNTEIVYQVMDNISGNLKYQVLLANETVSDGDRELYNQAMDIFQREVQYNKNWEQYLKDQEDFDAIDKAYTEANQELTPELLALKNELNETKTNLETTKAQIDADKVPIDARCIQKLTEIINEIDEITARIDDKDNGGTKDDKIRYKYYRQWKKHKEYLIKLNTLGVDIRLTVDVLKTDIEKIKEYIEKIQEVIDSFAGGPVNPLVGKFNRRLKQFTKRLLDIVEYINNDYPNVPVELNGTEDENKMTNEIFNQDIITSDNGDWDEDGWDNGDASIRYYYDLDGQNGVDQEDVNLLKKIIKLMAKNKISNPDKTRLIQALDTNGDGILDKVDLQWLQSYVQDAEEREWLEENNPSALEPYVEKGFSEEAQSIIDKVTNPNYRGEKFIWVKQSNAAFLPDNNSTAIFNLQNVEDTKVLFICNKELQYDGKNHAFYKVCYVATNQQGIMHLFVNNGAITLDKGASFTPTKKTIQYKDTVSPTYITDLDDLDNYTTYENWVAQNPDAYTLQFKVYYLTDLTARNEDGTIDYTKAPKTIGPHINIVMYNKSINDREFVFEVDEIPSLFEWRKYDYDLYTEAEANAYNVNLPNAMKYGTSTGKKYTELEVSAYNIAHNLSVGDPGYLTTDDIKTPTVYYTQEEANAYNSEHNLESGNPGYLTTDDIKTPAVYYTQEEADAYNAKLEGAKSTSDIKTEAVYYTQEEATAYNIAHNLSVGDPGYLTTDDWKVEPQNAIYGFESYDSPEKTTHYGTGTVEVIDQRAGGATVRVLTNEPDDPNAEEFVGQEFNVATGLATDNPIRLYTLDNEPIDIWVTITLEDEAFEGVKYTQEEATAYNTDHNLIEGNPGYLTTDDIKTPVVYYTQEEADAYNATLEGAKSTSDIKTEAVYYTQEEATAYNIAHNLSVGDPGYLTTDDIKTEAVYYTQEEANAHNTAHNLKEGDAGFATTNDYKLYTYDEVNAHNAKLSGAIHEFDEKSKASEEETNDGQG